MLSKELEHCLTDAFLQSRKTGHAHLSIKHLLLALLENPNVSDVLRARRVDLMILKRELEKHLDESTPARRRMRGT